MDKKITKRIEEIKQEIKELENNYKEGTLLDGEPMYTEAEYYMYTNDLEKELKQLENQN